MSWARTKPARSTSLSMGVRSATSTDGRRRAEVAEARHGPPAPGGPERAAAASRSDFLGPRDVLRGGRGREAARAQGHPKARSEGRFRRARRRARGAPSPSEAVARSTRIAEPRTCHEMRRRSPRPRAKAVRRAARPYDAPRRRSRSCPSPAPVARFGRNPSRALDFSGDVRGEGGRGHHDGTRGGAVSWGRYEARAVTRARVQTAERAP